MPWPWSKKQEEDPIREIQTVSETSHGRETVKEHGRETQLFVGDIDEEKRLSLQAFGYDQYFREEGWMGDWGGYVDRDLQPIMKPRSLKKKELWDLAGHLAGHDGYPESPEKIVMPILRRLRRVPRKERANYLGSICTKLMDDVLGLGLRKRFTEKRTRLTIETDDEEEEEDDGVEVEEEDLVEVN